MSHKLKSLWLSRVTFIPHIFHLLELLIDVELNCIVRRIGLFGIDSPKFLGSYSLLQNGFLTLSTICHHTFGILEVLLELELGFALVECLADNFGCVVGIVYVLVVIGNVLSLLEHKFD